MVFIVHKGSDDGVLGDRVLGVFSAYATGALSVTSPNISVGFDHRVAESETRNCPFQGERHLQFEVLDRLKGQQLSMGIGACGAHPGSIHTVLASGALGASWPA